MPAREERIHIGCLPFPSGKTGRSTVKANGTQNSGLVNFDRPGISFTICANQLHLPENDREGLLTGIKDGLGK